MGLRARHKRHEHATADGAAHALGAPPYAQTIFEVAAQQGVSLSNGLEEAEATRRLEEHGPNRLKGVHSFSALKLLVEHMTAPIILILYAALVVTIVFQEAIDAAVIGTVIVFNVLVGYFQEFRAEKTLAALKKSTAPVARVVRGGREQEISTDEVVPGDLVPCDMRLASVAGMEADEALLTGEANPVRKTVEPLPPTDLPPPVGDRTNARP
eukprot:tig00000857_g4939.t1